MELKRHVYLKLSMSTDLHDQFAPVGIDSGGLTLIGREGSCWASGTSLTFMQSEETDRAVQL